MPRKLILQMHMSLDGYVGGLDNSMDWINISFPDDLNAYISAVAERVDTILLGRKVAEDFIPAWRSSPSGEPQVDFINSTPKIVFSTTLNDNPWAHDGKVTVVNRDLEKEVARLKREEGRGILVYGGVQMARSLVAAGLVDELVLLIEPVTLGNGGQLFTTRAKYEVVETKRLECGIVILHYRRKT